MNTFFPLRGLSCSAFAFLALLALPLSSAATEHRSGDYVYAIAPAPDFVLELEVPEVWPEALSGAADAQSESWRNWINDDQVDLRTHPAREFRDFAVQALSTETLGDAAQLRVDFDPSWQQLTLHRLAVRRDGQWLDRLDPASITLARREQNFESRMYDGQVTALMVLKDVRIGDVVRLSYTLSGDHPVVGDFGMLGFSFGYSEGTALRQVRVLAPEQPGLNVFQTGGELAWQQDRLDDGSVLLASQVRDIPATRYADQAPSWSMQAPALFVARKHSWAEVARWALALYPEAPLSPAMQAAVSRIRAEHASPLARASAALALTQDEIRYFGMEFGASTHQPALPEQVLERRYGDCKDKSRLLVALLAALDIPAVPALVDTDYRRLLDRLPPSAGAFDHVIVRAEIEGRTFWLDPTQTLQRGPLDDLGFPDFERALLVAADTRQLSQIEAPRQPRDALEVQETILGGKGAQAELTVVSTWHGSLAEYVRRQVASSGHEAMSESYREFYSRSYGNAERSAPLKVEDSPEQNTMTITERYRIADYFKRDGDDGSAEFYAQAIGQFLSLPNRMERKGVPLALRHPLRVQHHFRVVLPEGARAYTADPFNETVEDPAWSFKLRGTTQDERTLTLDLEYRSRLNVVEGEAMKTHLQQRRKLLDELSRRVSFRWPSALGLDREQRLRKLLEALTQEAGAADAR